MTVARVIPGIALCLLLQSTACREEPVNVPRRAALDPGARFAGYTKTCGDIPREQGGIPGELPKTYLIDYGGSCEFPLTGIRPLSPTGGGYNARNIVDGICTWYFWQGGDPATYNGKPNTGGDPFFWRALEQKTAAIEDATRQPMVVTLLKFIDSRQRDHRFRDLGLINDPGCQASSAPDAFGLYLDKCSDPYASGIIGLRMSPNPKFDARHWDAAAYFKDPRKYEPPYLVGMTCGVCHIAFNPLVPPADPEHPQWKNLVGAIGNQYLREGKMFEGSLTTSDFLWHVYETQQAGTSDTSRLSNDFIDNPNAINGIYFITSVRPTHAETMSDGTIRRVPHVLKDGADSIGAAGAALRVYVNIGTCGAMRMNAEDVLVGVGRDQSPFSIKTAEGECQDYQQTMARIPHAAEFLDSQHGFPLASLDNGRYITKDASQLALGKRVFAENCARCHSSKVPVGLDDTTKHDPANKAKWVALVEQPDFLFRNFLSDDNRYPVVSADWRFNIGTNIKRTMGTNAGAGHIWQDFSSKTYKELKSPGSVTLYNPIDPAHPINFTIPDGHGYYRVPSLIAVWATAPLLHNNSLGTPTQDPSVEGRLRAFDDAMTKMFNPALRDGVKSIKRTSGDSWVQIGPLRERVPAGTPVDLLANVNLRALEKQSRFDRIHEVLKLLVQGSKGEQLLVLNGAPDFVEDHGHNFGSRLTAPEQRALIEYMKTF
jgi:hypothetical protein